MLKSLNKLLNEIESKVALYFIFGGPALVTIMLAYIASFSDWVQGYGAFLWVLIGLLGGFLTLGSFLFFFSIKHVRNKVKAIKKWQDQSDTVNPLESNFEKKRIAFHDIADPLTQTIQSKSFVDCDLTGPANIYLKNECVITHTNFMFVDLVIVRKDLPEGTPLRNVIALENVAIKSGRISNCTIFSNRKNAQSFLDIGMIPLSEAE